MTLSESQPFLNGIASRQLDVDNVLHQVPTVLSWLPTETLQEQLISYHLGLVSDRLADTVEVFRRAGVGLRLARLVNDLPSSARDRLAAAPESVRRLLYEPPTDLAFFLRSAQAEQLRAGAVLAVEGPVWTPAGDEYFPAAPNAAASPETITDAREQSDRPYQAPRLRNGIPVDYVSPFAKRTTGLNSYSYVPLNAEEESGMLDKFDAALRGIRAVSPEAEQLVSTFTRVIVVRKNPDDEGSFESFSTHRYVGRLAFVNAHSRRIDGAALASALVHEAIHSFLYIIEESRPLVEDTAGNDVFVVSPWTGQPLRLHSFLHACYVWFGLWRFWRRAVDTNGFDQQRAASLAMSARVGFNRPAMTDALLVAAPHLPPSTAPLVELVEKVRSGAYDS